jgi:glucose-1-phosphate cytidylyltransferase
MKAVILAGGFGTRISEESIVKPKPLIEVGSRPILWHIMKIYSSYGINDFIVCCGYKGHLIKEYFANYYLHGSNVTFDLASRSIEVHRPGEERWKVTCVETGEATMTGGRIKRISRFLDDEPFCLTYGDGVSDVNIANLIQFHRNQNAKVTLTAVKPPGRFGAFTLQDGESRVGGFREKPDGDGAWINGGFFVVDPSVLEIIDGDSTVWEKDPLEKLSETGDLAAFRHDGFWQPMDTLRDKNLLEEHWSSGSAPWKVW